MYIFILGNWIYNNALSQSSGMPHGYFLLKIIILFIAFDNTKSGLLKREDFNLSVIECLVKIIQLHGSKKLAIQFSDKYIKTTSEIIKNTFMPRILNTNEMHKWKGIDTRRLLNLVLVLNETINPLDLLNSTLWHSQTNFFVVVEQKSKLPDIFQKFWEYQVINVFTLVMENNDISIYTFVPFKPGKCDLDIKLINHWTNGTFVKNLLPLTKTINFNECPINISIVNVKPNVMFEDECNCSMAKRIDGIEGKIITEVVKKFNYTPTYIIPEDRNGWGWIHPQPAGVVGHVYLHRSEIGFGMLGPATERYENLDITVPYDGNECVTYGVPKGAGVHRPTWLDLLIAEFPLEIWEWFAISFLFITIVLGTLIRHSKETFTNAVFSYIFGITLQIPSKQPSGLKFRILFMTWALNSFILAITYQTSMGSSLTVPKSDPDVDTFKQLLASKLKLTGYNNMFRLMQYEHNEGEIKSMADRFIVTNFDIEEAVEKIASERNLAHVRHTTTFLYYALINPKAKGEIHVIKDCLYLYYPLFVLRKRSPFTKRVNNIVTNLKEMGLTQYWRSLYIQEVPTTPQGFVALSLNHLKGIFFMILIGQSFSVIFFAVEVTYKNLLIPYFKSVYKYFARINTNRRKKIFLNRVNKNTTIKYFNR